MSGTNTPRLALPLLAPGQISTEAADAQAKRRLDVFTQTVVQAVGTNTPPGSPLNGQIWIVGASPTGAWAGWANDLAYWETTQWVRIGRFTGLEVFNVGDSRRYRWTGSAWAEIAAGGGVQLIEEWTAAGGETTRTFSSLGAFRDLIVVADWRPAANANMGMFFNGDTTAANYSTSQWGQTSGGAVSITYAALSYVSGNSASSPGAGRSYKMEATILGYRRTTFRKSVSSRFDYGDGARNDATSLLSMEWNNTGAITSLACTLSASSFVAGSHIAVYGRV